MSSSSESERHNKFAERHIKFAEVQLARLKEDAERAKLKAHVGAELKAAAEHAKLKANLQAKVVEALVKAERARVVAKRAELAAERAKAEFDAVDDKAYGLEHAMLQAMCVETEQEMAEFQEQFNALLIEEGLKY